MICLLVLRLLDLTEASGNTYVPLHIIFFGQTLTGGVAGSVSSQCREYTHRAVCSQGSGY